MNIKTIYHILANWLLLDIEQPQELKEKEEKKIDFAVGGQAVIEGVMMRSPNSLVIAVRKKSGEIKIKKSNYQTFVQRHKLFNIPIIRGMINLVEMMVIGATAINYSASEMIDDEMTQEEKEKFQKENVGKRKVLNKVIESVMFAISLVVAIALSLFLFKFIPLSVATLFETYLPSVKENYILFNLIDGAVKIIIFLGYIYLLTIFKSFKRVFEYHGAEHKSIFTYESKLPLTVEHAKPQTRFHPRCGTSFILIVFVISILVYTIVPKQPDFLHNLLVRIALLPLIAGLSYEYLKLSAKYAKNCIVKTIIAPGLWFQRLTTSEPDNSQLEVGLKSLETALEMESQV